MTFLPIVERELRVAARRRNTYWVRLLMAVAAIILAFGTFVENLRFTSAEISKDIFMVLAFLTGIYCLLAGRRSTADCLSEEKREGTLGLLFLTDLNGYDVVLGKLVATSLNAFYGLLAVFPVLALPLLIGGITNGEFWRLAIVLVDTFLFSLAVGMLASAMSQDIRKAMALNFGLLFTFTVILPCIAWLIDWQWHTFINPLCYSSPIYCFSKLFALNYRMNPSDFWYSAAVIHALTWYCLIQASRIVPHSWQDLPPSKKADNKKVPRQSFLHRWSFGDDCKRAPYRKKLLDVNAFYWLASRARLKTLHVWFFLGLIGLWCIYVHTLSYGIIDDVMDVMTALLLNTTLKLWLTLEAGQRLAEAKKIGALELVLSTPLSEQDIVRGQMLALRRQFYWPTVAVVILDFFLMHEALGSFTHSDLPWGFIWTMSIFLLVADLIALSWVAMARALTARTYNYSIAATIISVLWLPWLIFGSTTLIVGLWHELTSPTGATFGTVVRPGWFFALSLAADVYFGWRARGQLLGGMRYLAAQRFASPMARATDEVAAPKKRSRKTVLQWAISTALVLAGVTYFWPDFSHKFPPPVVVPANVTAGPLQVIPGNSGALFLLPNGSLWHFGQTGGAYKAVVPESFTTNHWLKVATTPDNFVGVRDDGTLWEQTARYGSPADLTEKDSGHDWVAVAAGGLHSCAIKRDGTLWAWGNNSMGQLGNGTTVNQTNLVQIGTNTDWKDASCTSAGTLALRTDGTLWAWGRTFFFGNNSAMPVINNVPFPTQLCRETNWMEFASAGMLVKVRNRAGELWEPFYAPPDATLPASATCRLYSPALAPNLIAFAYCGDPTAFEIHADGTLWRRTYDFGATIMNTTGKWQKVGKRSDWVSLWGGGGAAFGLTKDGTLWTWGFDYTREAPTDFNSQLRVLHVQIMAALGTPPPGLRMGLGRAALWQFEKEPHALLQINPATIFLTH